MPRYHSGRSLPSLKRNGLEQQHKSDPVGKSASLESASRAGVSQHAATGDGGGTIHRSVISAPDLTIRGRINRNTRHQPHRGVSHLSTRFPGLDAAHEAFWLGKRALNCATVRDMNLDAWGGGHLRSDIAPGAEGETQFRTPERVPLLNRVNPGGGPVNAGAVRHKKGKQSITTPFGAMAGNGWQNKKKKTKKTPKKQKWTWRALGLH